MNAARRQDVALLIMRVGLGLIILYHGSQKMLGLFGGAGYMKQISNFQHQGIPPLFGNLAVAAEFFGGLGVLIGFLTPVAAFGIACTMAVAVFRQASAPGFFHEAFVDGKGASTAFYPATIFFLAVGLMLLGAGKYSVDAKVFGKKGKGK
jgi:putative oxidoreductase